jgi:hypothetical protein
MPYGNWAFKTLLLLIARHITSIPPTFALRSFLSLVSPADRRVIRSGGRGSRLFSIGFFSTKKLVLFFNMPKHTKCTAQVILLIFCYSHFISALFPCFYNKC